MKISVYNFDFDKAIKKINEKKVKKVAIQIPEGLKIHIFKIIDFFKKYTDAEFIICGDPCYGACDLLDQKYKDLKIDLIIHIGHTIIPSLKKTKIPIIFINANADLNIREVLEKAIPSLNGKKIGITTTAQHADSIDIARDILIKNDFEPVVGKGDKRIEFPGQIIGCNFSSANEIRDNCDMFLFIGSGNFHPLGMIISTNKDVIACDPYTKKVNYRELDNLKDIILKQRYGAISRAKSSKKLAVVVSYKKGQNRFSLAEELKKTIKNKGKEAYLIAIDYLNPENLETFRDIDCFVSTACPRIAIDDYLRYKTPIITPVELKIVLGIIDWEDYRFDEILDS